MVLDGDDDIDGKDDSEDDCESSVTVVNQPPSHVSISADTLENHSPFIKMNFPLILRIAFCHGRISADTAENHSPFFKMDLNFIQCCFPFWFQQNQDMYTFSADTAENHSCFMKRICLPSPWFLYVVAAKSQK